MCHWHHKLDMSGAFPSDILFCHLDTAPVAHDALVPDALVLAASALVITCRTKDALAEQTITLWLVGAIVDSLWLGDLTIRIFKDFLRGSQSDGDLSEVVLNFCIFFESHAVYYLVEFDT